MNLDEYIQDQLRAHADSVQVAMPRAEEVIGRPRRDPLRIGLVVVTAVAAVIAVAVWTAIRPVPTLDVADTPPGGNAAVTVIEPTLLDGTRLRLALPAEIVAAADQQRRWAGSLYAAASLDQVDTTTSGWRLEVRRGALDQELPDGQPLDLPDSAPADSARLQPDTGLGLAFGPWVALLSGDSLTAEEVDQLVDAVKLTETRNGDVEYTGPLVLWQVESPGLQLTGPTTAVSVFLRDCSDPATAHTPNGLAIARIEDPNRDGHLTVLCNDDIPIEIWLETPEPISDAALADVDVDVLTSGSILTGIDAGRGPGSRPNTTLGQPSSEAQAAD